MRDGQLIINLCKYFKSHFLKRSLALKNSLAFSTLESIVILPVVGLIVITAVDVSRVLQANSALQEAVHSSLRCAYTTDGDCHSSPVYESQPLFDVYSAETSTQWYQPRTTYQANLSWLEYPQLNLQDFRPTIIGSLSYLQAPRDYTVSKTIPVSSVQYNYLLQQASGPYVVNGSTGNARLDATESIRFVYGTRTNQDPVNYPRINRPLGRTLNIAVGQNGDETTIRNIAVPSLSTNSNLPCYRADNHNRWVPVNNRTTNYANSCEQAWLPMAFHLKGLHTSREGGVVKLSLGPAFTGDEYIRYQRGELITPGMLDLGGQFLQDKPNNDPVFASFVPRGVKRWSNDNGYKEYELYSDIYVQSGTKVRIKVELQTTSGSATRRVVTWTAEDLDVFFPDIGTVDPGIKLTCDSATGFNNCSVYYPNTLVPVPDEAKKNYRVEKPRVEQRNLGCKATGSVNSQQAYSSVGWANCSDCTLIENPNPKACLSQIDSLGVRKTVSCESDCIYDSRTKTCSNNPSLDDLNSGVSGNPNLAGSSSQEAAKAICSIPKADLDKFTYEELRANYNEYDLSFPREGMIWEQDDCSKPKEPSLANMPARYSRFKKAYFANKTSQSIKLPTVSKNPVDLKKTPKYSCMSLGEKIYLNTNNPDSNLPSDSMFRVVDNKYCNCEETAKSRVKTDSAVLKDFPDMADELYTEVSCVDTAPILVSSYPSNVCPAPAPIVAASSGWSLLPNGPYKQKEIPSICQDSEHTCKLELNSFSINDEDSNLDLEGTTNLGYSALQTVLPWAKQNCDGEDCVKLEISDKGRQVNAKASIKMNLRTLLNYPIEFSYENSRVYEAGLSGVNSSKE